MKFKVKSKPRPEEKKPESMIVHARLPPTFWHEFVEVAARERVQLGTLARQMIVHCLKEMRDGK